MLSKVRFILVRLQRASIPELFFRIREVALVFFLRVSPFLFRSSYTGNGFCIDRINAVHYPDIGGEVSNSTIDSLLGGQVFILSQDYENIEKCEKKWRGVFFSQVKYNIEGPDIRAVWEKGRLQNLTLLLWTYRRGRYGDKEKEIARYIKTSLIGWINTNPFCQGPHYMSVMECALRIPLFVMALQEASIWSNRELKKIARAIYQHSWITFKRLSLYSSLGNHTVTECVGLVFAGAIFHNDKNGQKWLQAGIDLLEQESQHQILSDGGGAEQSFAYHRFVLDLFWLAIDFLEKNGLHNCKNLQERVMSGERFLSTFQGPNEPILRFGDSDDGHVIAPGLYPAIRALYQAEISEDIVATCHLSGYSVIRTPQRGRLVMNHGPLGIDPLYNHGHADALSIVLSVGVVDFLVDPGTYMYNDDQKLRRYFKGTRGHNTVTIDNFDQATQLTSFVWSHPYSVERETGVNEYGLDYIIARHDGYARLDDKVIHSRKLTCIDEENFLVEDFFEGKGVHTFELNFHLHPDVEIDTTENGLILGHGGERLSIGSLRHDFKIIEGRSYPLLGWYSPSYGVLQKTKTLQIWQRGKAPEICFQTFFSTGNEVSKKIIGSLRTP